MSIEHFWERANQRHAEEVEAGKHDAECEWSAEENFRLCHCSKRRREAEGFTEPPTEDLYFPPPDCPHCDRELGHDGDGWVCRSCRLAWNTDGSGESAHFTDDHGDLSRCRAHNRRGCWHCREERRSAAGATAG